jgi:hypothetical protein
MQRFICLTCGAPYAVTIQSEPADREPLCEECESPLPDETEAGWLHYRRAPGASAASEAS